MRKWKGAAERGRPFTKIAAESRDVALHVASVTRRLETLISYIPSATLSMFKNLVPTATKPKCHEIKI